MELGVKVKTRELTPGPADGLPRLVAVIGEDVVVAIDRVQWRDGATASNWHIVWWPATGAAREVALALAPKAFCVTAEGRLRFLDAALQGSELLPDGTLVPMAAPGTGFPPEVLDQLVAERSEPPMPAGNHINAIAEWASAWSDGRGRFWLSPTLKSSTRLFRLDEAGWSEVEAPPLRPYSYAFDERRGVLVVVGTVEERAKRRTVVAERTDDGPWEVYPFRLGTEVIKKDLVPLLIGGSHHGLAGYDRDRQLLLTYGGRGVFDAVMMQPVVPKSWAKVIDASGALHTIEEWRGNFVDHVVPLATALKNVAKIEPEAKAAARESRKRKQERKHRAAANRLELETAGRIEAEDPTLKWFGSALAFVGDRLVVLAQHFTGERLLVLQYASGAGGWQQVGSTVEVLRSPRGFRHDFGIMAWGAGRAMVWADVREGYATALIDLESEAVTKVDLAHGLPCCRGENEALFVASEAKQGRLTLVEDSGAARPVLDEVDAFALAQAVFMDGVFWVLTRASTYGKPAGALRLYEVDRGGKVERVHALPDVEAARNTMLALTDAGLVIGGPTLSRIRRRGSPLESGTEGPWQTDSDIVGAGELIARVLRGGEDDEPVAILDSSYAAVTDLALANRTDRFLGSVAAGSRGWLALTYSNKKSHEGGIQLLRVSGRDIAPAKVLHDELTPLQRFEVAYPGFLDVKKDLQIRSWQLSAAVYQSMVDEGLAPSFKLGPFAAKHPTKKINTENSALVKEAVAYIKHAAEHGDAIDRLKHLRFDPISPELEQELYPFWDGEDDTFAITDLRGVERCAALERFTAYLGNDRKAVDVGPLALLASLTEVELSGNLKGLKALARAPQLRRLKITAGTKYGAPEVEALRVARPDLEVVLAQ